MRLSIVLALAAILVLPRGFWARKIGQSLVCEQDAPPSDALLLENFNQDYRVFKRAAALRRAGIASRIFAPSTNASGLSRQITQLMAQTAGLDHFEIIPFSEAEPISLNAANQVRDFLSKENIKSVVVIAPGFRSRRSMMVYSTALGQAGIRVGCVPIMESAPTQTWPSTWHGVQEVAEQFIKLQYYRFYVLW